MHNSGRRAPRLVTAAQRGYSFDLLLYDTKFATKRFLKRTALPTYAFRDAAPTCVAGNNR
jgi:hypothetical protein